VPDHFLIGGGGSQGPLWRQIVANVLGVSLQTVEGREHTAVGAAMLAGIGTRVFYDLAEAVAVSCTMDPQNVPILKRKPPIPTAMPGSGHSIRPCEPCANPELRFA